MPSGAYHSILSLAVSTRLLARRAAAKVRCCTFLAYSICRTPAALQSKRSKFIGFIFQFHFLMEDFTAQENVMIPMRKLGKLSDNEMRDRAAGLLEAVGLGDKLRRPSRHLSGGEQQRVAIARALANDPRVILADEPTGNLDTANSERAFELLQNIVQQGEKALLLATHNPAIAGSCDWIHEMKDGRITASHPRGNRTSNFGNSGN